MEVAPRRRAAARGRGARRADLPGADRAEGARVLEHASPRALPETISTDEQRLQQVLKNLLSNAVKFTDERLDRGCGSSRPPTAGPVAFAVEDTGHRHRRRQAAADLRGLPAGGRDDEPPLRGHRPRPLDQPRDRPAARRRDPGRERARPRQHLHAPAAADGSAAGARRRSLRRRRRRGRSRRRTAASRDLDDLDVDPSLLRQSEVADDRDADPGGRPGRPDRRGRGRLRPHRARDGARAGLQGHRRPPRRHRPRARPRVPARRDRARHRPARAGRLDRARAAEAAAADAAHPGAHRLGGRGAPARPPRRRGRRLREARLEGAARARRSRGIESFIERGVRNLLVVEDDDTERSAIVELVGGGDDVEVTAVGSSEEALAALEETPLRLHGPRPEAAEALGVRPAREGEGGRPLPRPAGDRLHRARPDPQGGAAAAPLRGGDRRQGRPLARAAARRDGALPAPGRVEAARGEAADARAAALRRRGASRGSGC